MAEETWYRGEADGVAPGRPGGAEHDLGDGLYLTDDEDIALQYAKTRAPGNKNYRVLEVTIDRETLGNVLDLTTDARWTGFMRRPMVPGSTNPNLKKSRLDHL